MAPVINEEKNGMEKFQYLSNFLTGGSGFNEIVPGKTTISGLKFVKAGLLLLTLA